MFVDRRIRRYTTKLSAATGCALLLAACGAGTRLPDETLSRQALPGGASACLYENANYGGASLCVEANNQRFTTWDNRVSSARVEAGFALELFDGAKFMGRSLKLTTNTPNLAARTFDNLTSSFKIGRTASSLPTPPASLVDSSYGKPPTRMTRAFYNNDIRVYNAPGSTLSTEFNQYLVDAWRYINRTYGGFTPDPRLLVLNHDTTPGEEAGAATIVTRFVFQDFKPSNGILLGSSWDWKNPTRINYDVITHELAHVVEIASKNTGDSPAGGPNLWGDGPWPEIFVYDVYRGLGKTAWAEAWKREMLTNPNGGFELAPDGKDQHYPFRDWFYPIYSRYGGPKVLNGFFEELAQCFVTEPYEDEYGKARLYTRGLNWGEFVHFWSGAAGANLKAQATEAFGWNAKAEAEFKKAQRDFACAQYPR